LQGLETNTFILLLFTQAKSKGNGDDIFQRCTPKSKKKFERSTMNSSKALLLRRYLWGKEPSKGRWRTETNRKVSNNL